MLRICVNFEIYVKIIAKILLLFFIVCGGGTGGSAGAGVHGVSFSDRGRNDTHRHLCPTKYSV